VNYLRFQRPSRYINNEINAVKKGAPLKVALAFPDIYDVGMSHLGLKILYDIINNTPYASAERVFHPWLDLEEAMRTQGTVLNSLESGRPLCGFDIVGFSLQYELSYTSVLNMLALGGIPLRSLERTASNPLVIAGGPSAINPLPMSPFIDAFLLGDGEEAVGEMLEAAFRWKTEGDGRRESLLSALAAIEGVYVPGVSKEVRRRFIASLEDAPYPLKPVVPYTSIVHDRVNIEVSRGCTTGCRFCQAGIIYRPLRERSPERALEMAERSLSSTGYEEVAFTSLSAGDYSGLLPLVRSFNRRLKGKMVSISLPSLKVKAVNQDILKEIKSVKKTGFTIAPEAATERLRGVINKDFGMEDYDRALWTLFSEGWQNLKLYFMIGLPTERDEDIEAIPDMVTKAVKTAKKHTRRFVNISVSASPFVPKPHTPFQWCPQADLEDIKRKKAFLRGRLRKVNFRDHDNDMSMLEAAFARGDEGLAPLIEAAYLEGARLDGWTESFDFSRWLRAMERTGIDAFQYAKRRYPREAPLPWEFVDTGVKKEFLLKEYDRALTGDITPDCRVSCTACGLQCKDEDTTEASTVAPDRPMPRTPLRKPIRVRVQFSKAGLMRHLSHRELITHVTRAIRRAGVQVDYTKGFHPFPRIAFGPPLGVGIAGLREYFDMDIIPGASLDLLRERINSELSEGVRLQRIAPVGFEGPSLQEFISRYEYEIICPDPSAMDRFLGEREVLVEREKGPVNVRPMVQEALMKPPDRVVLRVMDLSDRKVRLDELVQAVFGVPVWELDITRLSVAGRKGQQPLPAETRQGWQVAY
jgi:radical SAM-linked protein